ncbi:MAG: DUF4115 domain-containing protein [Thermaerobacter sp.]|nr:DUF4115 domain-containing protein [Thermaerobacter sp.]
MDEEQQQGDHSIGHRLNEARIRRRISLDEASASLHIRRDYLQALEQDKWEALPGAVYGLGFLRTYGRFLGLDGDRLVQERRSQMGADRGPEPEPLVRSPAPTRRMVPREDRARRQRPASKSPRNSGAKTASSAPVWLLLAMAGLFIGGLFLMNHRGHYSQQATTPPSSSKPSISRHRSVAPRTSHTATSPSSGVTVTPTQNNAATGAASYIVNQRPVTLNLAFTAPCWVEVWQNGTTANPYGHVYQAGQTLSVSGSSSVAVKLGNHNATLTVNGQAISLPDPTISVLTLSFTGQ